LVTAVAVVLGVCGCASQTRVVPVGPEVDVSRDAAGQAEVTIAAAPGDPARFLAGSNDSGFGTRVYESLDRGSHWTSSAGPAPPSGEDSCGSADPGVAIDALGREQYVFLDSSCGSDYARVFVSHRAGPQGVWETSAKPVAPAGILDDDDKPSIAVDESEDGPHPHRSYVVWTRLRSNVIRILLAASDDGGRTWGAPVTVATTFGAAVASVAVGRRGAVYVVWADPLAPKLVIARAADGRHFATRRHFATARGPVTQSCRQGAPAASIPAQPTRCVIRNPQLAVDLSGNEHDGRVYVLYGNGTRAGVQDVFVQAFDGQLNPEAGFPRRVNPPDGSTPSDQFLPAAAVDRNSGALWVCFYDTRGDRSRRRAWFTCTASRSGGTSFAHPRRAAAVASDETRDPADTEFGYGEYAGVAVAGGVAHPIWTDSRRIGRAAEEIFTRPLRLEGG
jgi:hypothetical protein